MFDRPWTTLALFLAPLLCVGGCASIGDGAERGDGSADSDADSDTDSDGDTDADTDADTDTDTDTDTGACAPDCAGKECGADGCGGYCGTCVEPPDDSCADGGIVEHFEDDQVGVCDTSTCLYESEQYACPAASTCGDDSFGQGACMGQVPHGNLEAAASTGISGWACDSDTPWQSIVLHLYFDSVPGDPSPTVRAAKADLPSEQPVADSCGGGDHHRFAYAPDTALLSALGSGAHTVYAFGINTDGIGSNPQIAGSPAGFTIP